VRTDNLIAAGTVVEVINDKSLVKADVLGRITDWLPVLQQANSIKKHFVSVAVNQQVLVLANRYVIGSLFNLDCAEPLGASGHIDITEYSDGTRIEYDTQTGLLKVNCVGKTLIESPSIKLVGAVTIVGDINHQGKLSNTAGIDTAGNISDAKGDLTSHAHINVAAR